MSQAQLVAYKSKALEAVRSARQSTRATVHKIEVLGGAFAAGYVQSQYPAGIAGVPAPAGLGLLLVGVGMGMGQQDLSHLGLGMLAGYAYDRGLEMGSPASSSTSS